jgi:hypothetical protein
MNSEVCVCVCGKRSVIRLVLLKHDYFIWCETVNITPPIAHLYCTVLYCTVLYCTVLYCTVLYCTVLYCSVLYCTVLYCSVLYCTVLYCSVLYCTVLFCTVLYCTVLYSTVQYSINSLSFRFFLSLLLSFVYFFISLLRLLSSPHLPTFI